MFKHAYDKLYLGSIKTGQACLFERVVRDYTDVDIDQFIKDYMASYIRGRLDEAWPKYASNPSNELLDSFIINECYTMPRGICHMSCDMAYWVGSFYSHYQWYWNISSAELVRWLPPEELGTRYPGLHDKSIALIVETWSTKELPNYDERYFHGV